MKHTILAFAVLLLAPLATLQSAPITTTEALVAAVNDGAEGAAIEIAAGTFALKAPLEPKTGMNISGAGVGKAIITNDPSWAPSTSTLPDPEMKTKGMDTQAYLLRLKDKAFDITVSALTLRGPQLHGAIFGYENKNLHLHHLHIEDVLWSGIRTFAMTGAKIHDCEFIDAGGRWERGVRGEKDGITGGAIFAIWMSDSEISHNRFTRTQLGKSDEFYGIKVRQAKRCRVHHNTIEANFSMEFPFENDEDVEISITSATARSRSPKALADPCQRAARPFTFITTGCATATRSSSSATALKSTTTSSISTPPKITAISSPASAMLRPKDRRCSTTTS